MLSVQIISDLHSEPITLQEAKSFMSVDYDDFDTLISTLITASRVASEGVTGKAYGPKIIQVTGNTYEDRSGKIVKIYPITPFVSDEEWDEEDENKAYRYNAGYQVCPADLKMAIVMRVATGFAYRQNGIAEAVNRALNASIITERQYVSQLGV